MALKGFNPIENDEIVNYGVMMTPGLVIDEKVVSSGKLPSEDELKTFLA